MKPRTVVPQQLIALARTQGGCLTSGQCRAAGLGPAAVRGLLAREWTRVAHGVHCVHPPGWESYVWAGVLGCHGDAVIGGAAALRLDGVLPSDPDEILVWRTHSARRAACPPLVFRAGRRTGHGRPVRTRPEDSILDCAPSVTEGDLVDLVGRALRARVTTCDRLLEAMSLRPRVSRRGLITELCTGLAGADSILEVRFAKDVVGRHRLPDPVRQVRMGMIRYDCYWPEHRLAVELDGYRYHWDRRFRDMERDNAGAALLGVQTLRYGWSDVVGRPCSVAAQLVAVLRRRGWRGEPVVCGPSCPCV